MSVGRRRFLKQLGLGAAGVGALGGAGGIAAQLVAGGARADMPPPARFVFVVEGNCFEPMTMLSTAARAQIDASASEPVGDQRWWYRTYRHDAPLVVDAGDLATAPALGALAMDPAVAAQSAVLLGMSSQVVGGGHSGFHGALASARTISGVPGGETIDSHLSRIPRVRAITPFDAVRLAASPGESTPLSFGLCASSAGHALPIMLQPSAAYAALFGSVGSDAGRAAFAHQAALLEFARQDVMAEMGGVPAGAEREKLGTYLSAITDLGARHDGIDRMMAALEANRPEAPDTNPLYAGHDPLDRFRAHLELATAALKAELTNVAVIGSGIGGDFNLTYTSVSSVPRHDMHHGSAASAELRDAIHEITRLQVSAIAQMASALAATPEPTGAGGTMLDHTLIVFLGDNGEQHHSTASEFPVLLIGGAALGLELGGRTIVYPGLGAGDAHRQLSNLWNTLGYAAGETLDTFGAEGPTRRAPGRLTEIKPTA